MKEIGKFFTCLISMFLFLILVLLTTVRLELLNRSFLFESFDKTNIYAQLPPLVADYISNNPNFSQPEQTEYAAFAASVSPQTIKPIIENNLTQILNFLNGKSKDLTISFSIKGIGFQNSSGFNWSPSQISSHSLKEKINALYGVSDIFVAAGLIILIMIIGSFFAYGKLSTQLIEGRSILFSGGIFVIAVSLISKLLFITLGKELMGSQQLSQKISGLILVSLSPSITTSWVMAGGVLISIWMVLIIIPHIKRS